MKLGARVKVTVQQGAEYVAYVGNLKQNSNGVVLTAAVCDGETYKEVEFNQRFVISIAVLED